MGPTLLMGLVRMGLVRMPRVAPGLTATNIPRMTPRAHPAAWGGCTSRRLWPDGPDRSMRSSQTRPAPPFSADSMLRRCGGVGRRAPAASQWVLLQPRLEPAGVRHNRPSALHEGVKPAGAGHGLWARLQQKVVGVAEDHLHASGVRLPASGRGAGRGTEDHRRPKYCGCFCVLSCIIVFPAGRAGRGKARRRAWELRR